MKHQVRDLTPIEGVSVDLSRLGEIIQDLGEDAAEQVICLALEELATGLARLDQAHAAEPSWLVAQADQIARLAWQVGLVSLAGVAVDVGNCAERRDPAALAATLSRLMRVGSQSLTRIWDRDDELG